MDRTPGARRPKAGRRGPGRTAWIVTSGVVIILVVAFAWRTVTTQPTAASLGTASGATVPTASLPSTQGHSIALSDYRGQKLVVYFYEGST